MDTYIYFSYSYIHTHRKRSEIYNNPKKVRKILVESLDVVASPDPEGPLLYFHGLMNRYFLTRI